MVPAGHQAGDEGDITGQPVELGDDDRALGRARRCKRRGELRAPLKGVGALSGLRLSVLLENGEAVSLCKECNGAHLSIYTQAGSTLPFSRYFIIRDCASR
jgi:hypothetical protein